MLYSQTDEFEVLRVRFSTLKHSLLFIYPKLPDGIKKIERDLEIGHIKQLMAGMKPARAAFRFGWRIFGDSEKSRTELFDLRPKPILRVLKNMGIPSAVPSKAALGAVQVALRHSVLFSTGESVQEYELVHGVSFMTKKAKTESVSADTLAERYERVIPFSHPFLFFVIDDPTGAILIMGRSSGYKG